MKGIILTLIVSMFASRMSECQKRKSEPTSPTEILNITGHWMYEATFTKGDSVWQIRPIETAVPNLKITSAGESVSGVWDKSSIQFCRRASCQGPVEILGGSVGGGLSLEKKITFFTVDSALGKIDHKGLVNIIRTDLPSGSPIRMMMSGTAEMVVKALPLPDTSHVKVTGPFSAERVIYNQKRLFP